MKNKVTFKEEPTLFKDITEMEIDRIQEHRRGSNFFTELIIEIEQYHKKYYRDIENFEQYLGTWRTNQVIWDDDYGFDESFSELTRVDQKEIISYKWVEVK